MENTELTIGQLFETIPYKSEEEVSLLIETMELPQAVFMITQALEMSIRNNLYSLHEMEIVLKSLRLLNKSVFKRKDDGPNEI